MRSVLKIFSPVIDPAYQKYWRKELKRLSKQLDAARDLDVFLMTHFQANNLDSELHRLLKKQKSKIYKELSKSLHGKLKQRRRQLQKELKRPRWCQRYCCKPSLSLTSLAQTQLNRLYQDLQLKAQSLDLNDEADLHQLRIAFKQLRYACEFLEPALDRTRSPAFINMMKALQDQLGDIHDLAVQQQMLADLPLSAQDELQQILIENQRHGQRLKKTLEKQVNRFQAISLPWQQINVKSESV